MTTTGPNRILDDFAKLLTDAAGAAQGVRREVENAFRSQAERILNSMDIVQREEFDAVREMAVKARTENERLAARIEALEARLGGASAEEATAKAACAKADAGGLFLSTRESRTGGKRGWSRDSRSID
jgi:BMFP domain-containing protein YqiC